MCVCERERGKERERECVCMCVRVRGKKRRERERERGRGENVSDSTHSVTFGPWAIQIPSPKISPVISAGPFEPLGSALNPNTTAWS